MAKDDKDNKKVKITFPDGSAEEYNAGVTAMDIAKRIGKRLAGAAVAVELDGRLCDLNTPIRGNVRLKIITADSKEGLNILRHSAAHVMAQAVKRLFPEARLTIGPAVEEGFYYDIDHPPFTPEDLEKIEAEMKAIVAEDQLFKREVISREQAEKLFNDNPYKLEMIKELEGDIAIYRNNGFFDLCLGPHVPSTGYIKGFKLTKLAGAYWRGDAKNKQLQRIYGVAFPDKKQLDDYLKMMEEAEKRDHRKLGKRLELFSIHDEAPGFPFFLPKGMIVKNLIVEFWRAEHRKRGYVEIQTPIILGRELWERSGHMKNYRENMYFLRIDEKDFAVKPMNCPGGMLVYLEKIHSYRELPLRVAELGIVHRHELSGVLAGLFRVRCFTQDDAHIYMTAEQIKDEIIGVIELCDYIYSVFGFEYHVELSTRPEKAIGTDEQWETATQALRQALEAKGMKYKVNEGDGAFYGPKIDFHLKDCIGRTWQCGTIQLDMAQPENFDLTYEGEDGAKHRPVMIHRTIYGSLERFMGILIEQFAGRFPLWLAPVQVRILTVADRFVDYANKIKARLEDTNLRVDLDCKAESVPYKVRAAQLEEIPVIITVGQKEEENNTVAVRTLDGRLKLGVKAEELVKMLRENIDRKAVRVEL